MGEEEPSRARKKEIERVQILDGLGEKHKEIRKRDGEPWSKKKVPGNRDHVGEQCSGTRCEAEGDNGRVNWNGYEWRVCQHQNLRLIAPKKDDDS